MEGRGGLGRIRARSCTLTAARRNGRIRDTNSSVDTIPSTVRKGEWSSAYEWFPTCRLPADYFTDAAVRSATATARPRGSETLGSTGVLAADLSKGRGAHAYNGCRRNEPTSK